MKGSGPKYYVCLAKFQPRQIVLAEPKQFGQIGCNLAQITRLRLIRIDNSTFECFARLGPIGQKKPKGKLASC